MVTEEAPSTLPCDTSTSPACQRLPGKRGISLPCPRAPPAHRDLGGERKETGEGRETTERNRGTRENPGPRVSGDRQRAGKGVEGERKGIWRGREGKDLSEGKAEIFRFVPGYPGGSRRGRAATWGRPRCAAAPPPFPRGPISTLCAPLPRGTPGVVVPVARQRSGAYQRLLRGSAGRLRLCCLLTDTRGPAWWFPPSRGAAGVQRPCRVGMTSPAGAGGCHGRGGAAPLQYHSGGGGGEAGQCLGLCKQERTLR